MQQPMPTPCKLLYDPRPGPHSSQLTTGTPSLPGRIPQAPRKLCSSPYPVCLCNDALQLLYLGAPISHRRLLLRHLSVHTVNLRPQRLAVLFCLQKEGQMAQGPCNVLGAPLKNLTAALLPCRLCSLLASATAIALLVTRPGQRWRFL